MKKRSLFQLTSALAFGLFSVTSCRKEPLKHLTPEESRIYVTNRDSSADFSQYMTFSIVDSVAVIQNDGQAHRELTAADSHLLQLLIDHMKSRGYAYVPKNQQPDLGINVTRISYNYLNVIQYPYEWWDYGGYWDPYYWGYPGYDYYFPTRFGFYQTQEDVLAIDLIDLKDATENDKELKGIWNATIKGEGVLDGGNYDQEISSVFDQSAYLQAVK